MALVRSRYFIFIFYFPVLHGLILLESFFIWVNALTPGVSPGIYSKLGVVSYIILQGDSYFLFWMHSYTYELCSAVGVLTLYFE